MTVFLIIPGVIALGITALIINALRFRPRKTAPAVPSNEVFDGDRAVKHLQELIRCKTVSYRDKALEDEGEFEKLYSLLPGMFPDVFKSCALYRPSKRSLIFAWKGKSDKQPGVLMAHYDVVPVVESEWSRPAFDGLIEDGVLWGRGTLDTKGTFLGVLEAADTLIAEGYVPENDLYLCFGGDEEVEGSGAEANVRWLEEHSVRPAFILDEGGAVVEGVFPGVKKPCAVVGIAEKGPMNITLEVNEKGGHASTPPARSNLGILARAVSRIEGSPFPLTLTPPALKMFDAMARHSTFLYRLIFANLRVFAPVLDLITRKSSGELNALVRTTVAFTMAKGSDAFNVLPNRAVVGANLRIIPGETPESTIARLEKVINDSRVKVTMVTGGAPSKVSETDCPAWDKLVSAISATWTDAMTSPYLMLACSDSRSYCRISDHVYRFSAMALSKEERGMIHGRDERVPLETVKKTVSFYRTLIKKL